MNEISFLYNRIFLEIRYNSILIGKRVRIYYATQLGLLSYSLIK
jgi:hypothetical protein